MFDERTTSEALACSAIGAGLESILVFDATPERMGAIAQTLIDMVEAATGEHVVAHVIGPTATNDLVWGAHQIGRNGTLEWTPGLLASDRSQLVIIRNLAVLSLEAQRTLVAAVGADVVHLERHGQSDAWRPRTYWLAACAREDVGKVSPHVLDRFAVRIDAAEAPGMCTAGSLQNEIEHVRVAAAQRIHHDLDLATLSRRRAARPALATDALARVIEYFPDPQNTTRRSLCLARFAKAYAALVDAPQVLPEHVDAAAVLLGLPSLRLEEPVVPSPPPAPIAPPAPVAPPSQPVASPPTAGHLVPAPDDPTLQPVEPPRPVTEPGAPLVPVPYEEDRAPVERERTSLVFPAIQQRATVRATRGAAIGVMRTHELHDLAISATLVEAATHMRARKASSVIVTPADLFRYRRVAPVERMLALVVDHTSVRDWDWGAAVLQHLRTAYVQRAAVCLVQVGTATGGMRAQHTLSRSMLAAPVDELLSATPGIATPLAHGLELAFETLRHALQHGRGAATRATLVVVTDARGNIPLEASRRGELVGRVRDDGVRDAMAIAQKLRGLDRLERILIEPPLGAASHLPVKLAEAMGAVRRVPRVEEVDDA